MSLWRLQNFYLVLHKMRVPRIYVGGRFHHKTYMIQTLRAGRHVTRETGEDGRVVLRATVSERES